MLPALLKKFIKHCGAAIESLIIETGWVAYFYLATAKMIDKSLCTMYKHTVAYLYIFAVAVPTEGVD